MNKIKVVWICQVSNSIIRKKATPGYSCLGKLIRRILGKSVEPEHADMHQWITNGINEFEKFDNIELHVVSFLPHLRKKYFNFIHNGVYYHLYRNQIYDLDEIIVAQIKRRTRYYGFNRNIRRIIQIIKSIKPDIIHLIGAEIPSYAGVLDNISHRCPKIVQLQTLVNVADFRKGYPVSDEMYEHMAKDEMTNLYSADFIGTKSRVFAKELQSLVPNKIVLSMNLALTEEPKINFNINKKYDFVYFAKNIEKSIDWAIESFILANQKHPGLTMLVVGKYEKTTKENIEKRLLDYNLIDNVYLKGSLPTHDDVLMQIQEARCAVLPMKVDLVTGTIREAMAYGIPVVTNITPESPKLNGKRMCVLLSEKEDFEKRASDMVNIIEDVNLAKRLSENSILTSRERSSNAEYMQEWVKAYKAVIQSFKYHIPIPDELIVKKV